jgi:hypothetical protein
MSDATTDEGSTAGLSWLQALLYSALITVVCLAFAVAWEAIAQATGDF